MPLQASPTSTVARICCYLILCTLCVKSCQCFCPPNAAKQIALKPYARSTPRRVGTDIDGTTKGEKSIVAALTKMETIMNPGFGCSSSLDRFHKTIVSAVEVRESSIPGAGMGLFARKNIEAGTIVCFYPAHCIGIDGESGPRCVSLDESDHEYFDDQSQHDGANYLHYLMGNGQLMSSNITAYDGTLFIDVNPHRPVAPGWVGHYINDGSIVRTNNEDGVLDYYAESRHAQNCANIPFGPSPVMATCTTKKVKKGAELFTTYGCPYWLKALLEAEGGECADILDSDAINDEVRETAKDLLQCVQRVGVKYEGEANALRDVFEEVPNSTLR